MLVFLNKYGNMTTTILPQFRVNYAEQFKESVSEPTANTMLYVSIGRNHSWSNDALPPTSNTSISTVDDVWDNIIGAKRIVGSDIMHVVPRIDWTANTVYDYYDPANEDLFDSANTQFYVVTNDYNVYKCINNNSGAASTQKPTSINPYTTSITADGYVWKFMYNISDINRIRFTTSEYIPVKVITVPDSSLQYLVQQNAIDGGLSACVITSGGSGYLNVSNLIVTISGDGGGASAVATINNLSNTVNSIVITDPGYDYSSAEVSISGGAGSGATARAIVAPKGGHGFNPLYELCGKNLLINMRIKYDENGKLPTTNEYRQLSIIKDPDLFGTSNTSSLVVANQTTVITTAGTGSFQEDEIVYQGPSLSRATFKGRVAAYDSALGKVYLINTYGDISVSDPISGSSSFVTRFVSSYTDPDLEPKSGQMLYVQNMTPKARAQNQIEEYKIILKF